MLSLLLLLVVVVAVVVRSSTISTTIIIIIIIELRPACLQRLGGGLGPQGPLVEPIRLGRARIHV